jgi:hypothetical protein
MVRLRQNTPHQGLLGKPRQKAPLDAGAHMPPRETSGFDDRKGYQAGDTRRMGKHTGPAPKEDQRRREGAEGNSKGSAPPGRGKGVNGSPDSYLGTAGRGAPGKFGKADGFKGKHAYAEEISHNEFERLGAK